MEGFFGVYEVVDMNFEEYMFWKKFGKIWYFFLKGFMLGRL